MRYPSENSRKGVERTMVDVGWIHSLILEDEREKKKEKQKEI